MQSTIGKNKRVTVTMTLEGDQYDFQKILTWVDTVWTAGLDQNHPVNLLVRSLKTAVEPV